MTLSINPDTKEGREFLAHLRARVAARQAVTNTEAVPHLLYRAQGAVDELMQLINEINPPPPRAAPEFETPIYG